MLKGLALYYQFHQNPQVLAIKESINQIESIKNWFEKQKTYHFFSSSFLVFYESNLQDISNSLDENSINRLVKIKMVDFAHVFPADNCLDLNYLFGIYRLISYISILLKSDYFFIDIRKN